MASVAKHPEATVVADEQYVGIFFSLQISVNLLKWRQIFRCEYGWEKGYFTAAPI